MDRQHQIKRLAGILFIAVLPLLNPAYGADKNTRQTSPDGDEGYFGGGSPGNTNAMILWPRDDHNIVRKYRPAGSAAPSPLAFKLWVNPGRRGGFPVNLKTASAFCSFLQNIGKDPDKGACICEDDPARPYTGAPLGACAGVNFPACNPVACTPGTAEEPGETDKPCAEDPWETGEWQPETEPAQICKGKTLTQTRRVALAIICDYRDKYPQPETERTITGAKTDGECAAPEPCTERAWSPARSKVCAGSTFTQKRRYCQNGRQRHASRSTTGTKYCPPPTAPVTRPTCQWTKENWTPARSRVCAGEPLTQTRNVSKITAYCQGGAEPASSRSTTGTKYCPPPDPVTATRPKCQWSTGTWKPGRSTVCAGEPFMQTRSVRKITSHCEGGTKPESSRSATGTRNCPPTCRWRTGNWSPSPASTCSGQRVSQNRSVTKITANCVGGTKPESTRTVPGSKRCPTCDPTSWSPGRDTVCAGDSFTQTRTLANCSTRNRAANGAKKCCRGPNNWKPSPATVCGGKSFTQKGTDSCGKTHSRPATGTKTCYTRSCRPPQSSCNLPGYSCPPGKIACGRRNFGDGGGWDFCYCQ